MSNIFFADLGSALAGSSAARLRRDQRNYMAEEQAAEQADAPHVSALLKGDRTALDRVSPKTAIKLAPYLEKMDASQRTRAKEAADYTARAANAILQADPAQRPAVYAQLLQDGTARGFDLSKLPPQYTPDLEPKLRSWRLMADQFLREDGGVTYAAPDGGRATPAAAIGGIESGGRYDAVGPVANGQGQRAFGKYQVLEPNIGPWTQEVLGKPMSPQEFLASPQAQDAVFGAKFGQYEQKYGPEGAARAWFAGEGGMNNPNAKDVLGTTVAGYGQKFAQATGAAPAGMPQGDGGPPGSPAGAGPQGAPIPIETFKGVQLPPGYRIGTKGGQIFSPVPGYVQVMPPDGGAPVLWPVPKVREQGAGPFAGTGTEAQALNMLIANGTLTQQQAAELAAGKTITNPADGSIIFMTPSGLFSRPGGAAPAALGNAPAPQAPSVTVQAGQPGAPAPGGIQVTPAKKDPAFKKLETEVMAVNSAIDNFNNVLKEAGGGSFNAFINNPQSPEAQKVNGAFNALKTALRSEAFVNTGVLQPAEMTMLDNMLLAPTTLRGLFATPEAYAAMLDQIKQFVAGKMTAARGAYGQPDAAAPPTDLKKKYGLE